jgi:hypothetical protein
MKYMFDVAPEPPLIGDRTLYLTGARLVAGEFRYEPETELMMIADPHASPVTPIKNIICRVVPATDFDERIVVEIPMYRQMLVSSMDFDPVETRIVDSESANLVWGIKLPCKVPENELLLNGTCIFCQMTDQLS